VPTRPSTNASRCDGAGRPLQSPMMRMRQVEQRARPPHTLACGTLLRRLASSTLNPSAPEPSFRCHRTGDRAAAPFDEGARTSRQQDKTEQAEIADHHGAGDPVQDLLLRDRPDLALRKIVRPPVEVVAVGDDAATALIDTQERQRRNQHAAASRNGAARLKNAFIRSQK